MLDFPGNIATFYICIIFNTLINIISNMTILSLIFSIFVTKLGFPKYIIALVSFTIFFVIMAIVVETEKLKPLTFLVALILVVIAITFTGDSMAIFVLQKEEMVYTYWDINNLALFVGVANYSFESIGGLINSKKPPHF